MTGDVAPALIRGAALLAPVALTAVLWWWRRPDRRLGAGILLAVVWNATTLLALQVIAVAAGWWHFSAVGGEAFGVPVDLLLGWTLLWGAVPLLAFARMPLVIPVAVAALVDIAVMPAMAPVVNLGQAWLVGEAAALALCLVPGLVLGRSTAADTCLPCRAMLQVVLAGALVLWLVPAAALERPDWWVVLLGGGSPARTMMTAAAASLVGLASLVGMAAVCEFAERGGGTPLPYDPPRRLVRSGPYAYCRNPMQSSVVVTFAVLGAATANMRLGGAALVGLAYSAGLAVWHEQDELPDRFGWAWMQYRVSVRPWRLRRRPANGGPQATVWIGRTCEQCAPFARFLTARRPTRLTVRPAESHPGGSLERMTYEVEGQRWHGVAAFARALEHLHLGWALAGWALRLPGVVHVVQVVVDASGGGPRRLPAAGVPAAE